MTAKPWSEWRKWWMDVIKWFVGTVAGFGLTFWVFNHFEQRRSEDRAVCVSRMDGLRQAVVQFNSAASAYRAASWDAFIELYRWRSEQPTEPIQSWWRAWPTVESALWSLETAYPKEAKDYPKVAKDLHQFQSRNNQFFQIVRSSLINPRLDAIEALYKREKEPTAEERWEALKPISRTELTNKRATLEKLLNEMDWAQKSAAATVRAALLKPASSFCEPPEKTHGFFLDWPWKREAEPPASP